MAFRLSNKFVIGALISVCGIMLGRLFADGDAPSAVGVSGNMLISRVVPPIFDS
jgi:hypothetical protein